MPRSSMTPAEIQGWILLGGNLVTMGYDAAAKMKAVIKLFRSDISDDDLDAIIRAVIADAKRRKAIADDPAS